MPARSSDPRAIARLLKLASTVAYSATTVDQALQWALDLVCDYTGWPLGHVFMLEAGVLVSKNVWHDDDPVRHAPFVAATGSVALPPGAGLPGRILETGEPAWIMDVRADPNFVRGGVAVACGIGAGFGFPIVSSNNVEGIMEFFAPEAVEPDAPLLDLISHIGVQLGSLVDRTRAQESLQASEMQLRTFVERLNEAQRIANVGFFSWEVTTDSVTWSPELYRIYGLDPDAGPATVSDYLARVHPDDRERVGAAVQKTLATLEPYEHDYRVVLPSGDVRWVHARGEAGAGDDGAVERLTGYCQDITVRKDADGRRRRAQVDLASHQRILERIARREPVERTLEALCREIEKRFPEARCSVLLVDPNEGVLRHAAGPSLPDAFNQAIDGLPVAAGMGACGTAAARKEMVVVADTLTEPLTRAFVDLAVAYDLRSVWSHPLTSAAGEVLGTFALYRASPHRPETSEIRTVTAAGGLAALAIERSLAEKALTRAAQVDSLTGLPNRARFLERLRDSLAEPSARVAVMFLDLDGFKWINDSLGHPAGDRILVDVARRLDQVLDRRHDIARFGGDEFTVLIRHATPALVEAVAEDIEAVFQRPFLLDGGEFFISVSVGVALNDHPADAYGLVRDADAAMYAAKERGRARHAMFDERLRRRAVERVTLETELRRAIERDEFVMHYQPILDLATGRWAGVEALVRWRHPARGLLQPADFIPLAEETGLIVPLGLSILDRVATQAAAWRRAGDALHVAANVSVVQLADPTFASAVAATLARHHLDPELLLLEVTETAVMEQVDVARTALEQIAALGLLITVDDFGTGYSSIARLGELPVVGIKIDRQFTSQLGADTSAAKVLAAITDLAHALDLQVVAEGIETEQALVTVTDLGCNYGQGFHLARPVAPADLPRILSQR